LCYAVGIEYERVTRHHFIFDIGLEYGITRHKVNVVQDFSDFDTAASNLSDYSFDRKLDLKFHYLSPRLLIGYQYPITHDWSLVGKVGLSVSLFLDGYNGPSQPYVIDYTRDNGTAVNATFMSETISIGDSKNHGGSRFFSFPLHTYECYIGVEHSVKRRWIKKLAIGLEGTRAIRWNDPPGIIQISSLGNVYNSQDNIDSYRDRNFSLGLRLSLGLWK
jgi:hypothetical protein